MTKIALLVGIDDYPSEPLTGCEKDANRIKQLLETNEDDTPNFECKIQLGSKKVITRPSLKKAVENLFRREADVALFYFSGHGTANNLGGYLVTQDAEKYDEGLSMSDVLTMANNSPAKERIIILDCCNSGSLGQLPAISNDAAMLKEGVSILSASRESEDAMEVEGGGGIFTSLMCDALNGGAADVRGKVTSANLYAYADETLGGFDQRPLFKIHVSKLVTLRDCTWAVDRKILKLLPKYFKSASNEYPLDESYESTSKAAKPEHTKIMGDLQKMRAARLVVPVGEEHLYFAAMNKKSCKLTSLGLLYWRLAKSGRI